MEVTVSSIFTTTPRRKPCEGQVPTPTMFSFPSRSSSPTRTQIFVVPTSIPTITCSCIFSLLMGGTGAINRAPTDALRIHGCQGAGYSTHHHNPSPAPLQYLTF